MNLASKIGSLCLTDDRKTRIRIQQWSATVLTYLASAGAMALLARWEVLRALDVALWLAFVATGLAGTGAWTAARLTGTHTRARRRGEFPMYV